MIAVKQLSQPCEVEIHPFCNQLKKIIWTGKCENLFFSIFNLIECHNIEGPKCRPLTVIASWLLCDHLLLYFRLFRFVSLCVFCSFHHVLYFLAFFFFFFCLCIFGSCLSRQPLTDCKVQKDGRWPELYQPISS